MILHSKTAIALASAGASLFAGQAGAGDIIWDYGPATGRHNGNWANQTQGQNFAEDVLFGVDMFLTGVDIFTSFTDTPLGDYHVKILLDDGAGNPSGVFAQWDQDVTTISVDDSGDVREFKHSFDFDPIVLSANTVYWIGVSANGWEVGQSSLLNPHPDDGTMAQFSGNVFSFHTGVGDQMFQLRGYPVPGPAGVALLGCAGLALGRRRQRRA